MVEKQNSSFKAFHWKVIVVVRILVNDYIKALRDDLLM